MKIPEKEMIHPMWVGVFVVDRRPEGHRYLLMRRCGPLLPGNWQMVTGGILNGEKAWEAALREVHEETGLPILEFYSADFVETFYFLPKDEIAHVPAFVAFVDGCEQVNLSPNEHDAFEWLPFEEALNRLEFITQRNALRHIEEDFLKSTPCPHLQIPIACNV